MNEKNKNHYFWIIIILLIIIILILLFFNRFGKIENKYIVPTGNVDVFNIDINCNCIKDDKCNNKENNVTINNNAYPVWNEQKYENELNEVYIDDENCIK